MAVVARPGALQAWLQPPAVSASTALKRKRAALSDDTDESSATAKVPAKKATKTGAKPKASTTPATKPAPADKAKAKEAKKLYTDTIKAVEKRYLELDKKVKAMSPNSRSITVANYTTSAAKMLGTAKKLAAMGEDVLAFNFVMALADASHRNLSSFRMSGTTDDCKRENFRKLDEALLAAIKKRSAPAASDANELPSVPHRWTNEDAEVGEFRTSNGPHKQQRNLMERQYIDWEKARRAARRDRREKCGDDWVRVALDDLKADRDYHEKFGVSTDFDAPRGGDRNVYFEESIKEMEKLAAEKE